jgi:transposase
MHISRQDMSNWTIAAARRLGPLIELFRDQIRAGPVVQMDETPVQVLKEPGRENTTGSFMWLARGGPPQAPVCLYHYEQTRGGRYVRDLLIEYQGYLQADGYQVYEKFAAENRGLTLVGCWAHARRKFFEAAKGSKKSGAAHEAMGKIKKLYRLEQELRSKDLDAEVFLIARRAQAEPILDDLNAWLAQKSQSVVPGSLLGKAVGYALKQWDSLIHYLDHPALTPDNNAAENAIRPFVLGRKNWLFNGSPRGADSSCAIYSIIETAKQNGLNPYAYLHYILSQVPKITAPAQWANLLPQNLDPEEINNAPFAGVR